MSWTKTTVNEMLVASETVTLADTTYAYTSEIDFLHTDLRVLNKYVAFYLKASAVTAGNLDIALHGAYSSGGTKVLLKDAVVADITDATAAVGIVDINAYPAPYYYISALSADDESANTIDVIVSV